MKKFTLPKRSEVKMLLMLFMACLMISQANAQVNLLPANTHPKFVNPLPVIQNLGLRIDLTAGTAATGALAVNMRETTQDLLGNGMQTRVWGYQFPGLPVTYPGATIIAMENTPVEIMWKNKLPGHFLPVDASLHMAHPANLMTEAEVSAWYAQGNVPTVTHLHGGHTESASDGLPEAWFTRNFKQNGAFYVKRKYWYDNSQEAATLWYHDHALGITRLNVYAGLAGFYLLRDVNENNLITNGVLPGGNYEIEIVVQDRMFTADGQLFFPSMVGDPFFDGILGPNTAGIEPSIVAEFFGDFILVNGKAWPKLDVEQTKYRFRLLNGSDSRVYNFAIQDGNLATVPFMQIGTDDGLLPSPVNLSNLILAPGERADIVVDFSGHTGSLTVVNTGPDEPFKGNNFDPDVTRPAGQIMRFDIIAGGTPPTFSVTDASGLRTDPITPLVQTGATRKLALFEGEDAAGRLQPLLGIIKGNNTKGTGGVTNGSLAWFEPITEYPGVGDVEVWEVYNNTEDAHPIHLHLVSFQILERRPFTATVNVQPQVQHAGDPGIGAYVEESSIVFTGPAVGPPANEQGWKDTFVVPPGQMGKLIARFDRAGRYVWHCHILSHEDHEMMRPFEVGGAPPPPPPIVRKSATVEQQPDQFGEFRLYPNPASDLTTVDFVLEQAVEVTASIYGMDGRMLNTEKLGYLNEGIQTIEVPVGHLDNGMYIFELKAGDKLFRESFVVSK